MKPAAFQPIAFQRYELFFMRALFALLVWHLLDGRIFEQSQPVPVGIGRWIDFSFLSNPEAWRWIRGATAVALVVYVTGRGMAVVLPWIAAVVVGYGTLKNSQGAATHHLQAVALIVVVQAAWYLWRALAGRFRIDPDSAVRRLETHRLAAWHSMQALIATYIVTAITKIFRSEGEWIKDSKYFPLQLEKAQQSDYYNTLQAVDPASGTVLDRMVAAITDVFVASPNLCRFFLTSGLVLEAAAFLALRNRRWAFWYGAGLILFHLTISRVMQLTFDLNMAAILIFLVNLPYWIGRLPGLRGLTGSQAS